MTQPEHLKTTPLYVQHLALGAKMVPFAGWSMPVQYTGVLEEHRAVRSAIGLFDVSHMGEIDVRGPNALLAVNQIITNDVCQIIDGQALYTVMCREDGGIIDDLIVVRLTSDHLFLCVNASNREKDFKWIKDQAIGCEVRDVSDDWALLAVQGPRSAALLERLVGPQVTTLKSYHFLHAQLAGMSCLIARTGYTGEDGFELYIPGPHAPATIWQDLLQQGADLGIKPAGLGARDSLRLEMRYPLFGQDIDETKNPIQAGLGWVVKFGKPAFNGREALERIHKTGPDTKLVGLALLDRGIARPGYPVLKDGVTVGHVTSGTLGPTVKKAIALAYVPMDVAAIGSRVEVQIRANAVPAEVVKTPFYSQNQRMRIGAKG